VEFLIWVLWVQNETAELDRVVGDEVVQEEGCGWHGTLSMERIFLQLKGLCAEGESKPHQYSW